MLQERLADVWGVIEELRVSWGLLRTGTQKCMEGAQAAQTKTIRLYF